MQNGRKRRSANHKARPAWLPRALGIAGAALALAAVVLLVSYLIQGHQTRQEQATQRALFRDQATANPAEGTPEASTGPAAPEAAAPGDMVQVAGAQESSQAQLEKPVERQVMDDRFLPLMRRNSDTVGWLSYSMIPEIDFAVVQRDNEHYMYRGFTGEKNVAGTVFLDQGNSIRPRDRNLILHGHNMKNGTMFGKLARLMDGQMLKAQPLFTFDTLYQDARYVPYALTVFSVDPRHPLYFDVIKANFEEAAALGQYVNWLREHSALRFPTQVEPGDRLLTLVTCHGADDDERLVLALRAVRPGEDAEALVREFAAGLSRP